MSEPIELFGVTGLLLPGSAGRPCPWIGKYAFHTDYFTGAFSATNETLPIIAACWAWWFVEVSNPSRNYSAGEEGAPIQSKLWLKVYLEAERRIKK